MLRAIAVLAMSLGLVACSAADLASPVTVEGTEEALAKTDLDRRCAAATEAPGTSLDGLSEGLSLWLGEGGKKDLPASHAALEGACAQGVVAACATLGMMFETGSAGLPVDHDRAYRFLRESSQGDAFDFGGCEEGSPAWRIGLRWKTTACCRGVRSCPVGCEAECEAALARVRQKTTDLVRRGCERGEALACYLEATLLAYGSYFEPLGYVIPSGGSARVHGLYERACRAGIGRACSALAMSIDLEGILEPVSEARKAEARALEARACALGDGYGCYEVGAHAEMDPKRGRVAAYPVYEKACELGMRGICKDLSEMYASGEGVPEDPAKSARFLFRSHAWPGDGSSVDETK